MVAAQAEKQAQKQALSEQDVVAARAEVAGGRAVTVWFTASAVGVPAGGSAKIVSMGDVAEGDFIQVRPTGSRDTVFCSSGELTRARPPRRQAGAPEARPPAERVGEPADRPRVAAKAATGVTSTAVLGPAPHQLPDPVPDSAPLAEEKVPDRPRSGGRAGARAPAEVSVTLSATGDGEWTVEVMVGKKRTVRPTPVQPGDVAVAARALPPAVAEAISSSLDAARRRRADQVERLRAELDAAERALKELNG